MTHFGNEINSANSLIITSICCDRITKAPHTFYQWYKKGCWLVAARMKKNDIQSIFYQSRHKHLSKSQFDLNSLRSIDITWFAPPTKKEIYAWERESQPTKRKSESEWERKKNYDSFVFNQFAVNFKWQNDIIYPDSRLYVMLTQTLLNLLNNKW